jgi:hypothetical protein
MTLELTSYQVEELAELLESTIGSMAAEIHHTDSPDYRATLRQRREALREVLAQLIAVRV